MPKQKIDMYEDLYDHDASEIQITEDEFFIRARRKHPPYGILFNANMYVAIGTYNAIHFVIRTKDWETGERHPYFEKHRASDLAARAIRHFEQFQPVYGIEFDWVRESGYGGEPSDNYITYIETRNRLRNEMSIKRARREAALATWTMQKIALPNGFTVLGEIDDKPWPGDDPDLPTNVKGMIWRDIPSLDLRTGKLLTDS